MTNQAKTIAVLPFVNMSTDPNNEYFCDGMTEEIINALTKIQNLKVTSRTSSFYFKNKNIPIPQIAQELNVATILEGSVRLGGNKMRITAQLIDVEDDVHFWSETFDRSLDDIFAVQDEISLLIAERLREHLGHFDIEDHLVEDQQIPTETYQRYLKARFHLLKMNKTDIDLGLSILNQTLKDQPQFALAYFGMNLGYTLLGTLGLIPYQEGFEKAQPFLEKAIELEPDLPECQLHLSWISFLQEWDFEKTYLHLNKILEKRPIVDYYQTLTTVLVAESKFAAAMHYIEIAIQIDPFSDINYHLKAFVYYSQEKFEEAVTFYDKSVQLASNYALSTLEWGQALICLGRAEEALALFQKLPEDITDDMLRQGGVTLAFAALGDITNAKKGIQQLEATLQTNLSERALKILIYAYVLLNEQDKALELIKQGIQQRLPLMIYLPTEPLLKPLKPIPQFQDMMRQILAKQSTFEPSIKKYKQNLLAKDELKKYKNQLQELMQQKKPYLEPNLTLKALAELLNISSNQLSRVLNQGFQQNFAEFVNTYRLETFKNNISDPTLEHLTILGLAYESGFNSKTVFNSFFKKMMDKTPKAYWKEIRNK